MAAVAESESFNLLPVKLLFPKFLCPSTSLSRTHVPFHDYASVYDIEKVQGEQYINTILMNRDYPSFRRKTEGNYNDVQCAFTPLARRLITYHANDSLVNRN